MQKSVSGFYKKPINKVGVRNMKVPFVLQRRDKALPPFHTVAKVSSYCNLISGVKGINMSRSARTINDVLSKTPTLAGLNEFVDELLTAHESDDVYIKAEFDYVTEEKSPVTELMSMEPIVVVMESTLRDGQKHSYLTVRDTEMSLCPCSKEMSLLKNNLSSSELEELAGASLSDSLLFKLNNAGFGAHNQKSKITITVEMAEITTEGAEPCVWIEDLVTIAQLGSSCRTWATLKRPDEKYVTEVSYMGGYYDETLQFNKVEGAGPKFVEDIARDIAKQLDAMLDTSIKDYCITILNEESIHSQDIEAVAVLTAGRDLR
jgi:GTP cyclohydrolase I